MKIRNNFILDVRILGLKDVQKVINNRTSNNSEL